MTKPLDVTEDTFEQEVLKSEVPVLADFWAPWCLSLIHIYSATGSGVRAARTPESPGASSKIVTIPKRIYKD